MSQSDEKLIEQVMALYIQMCDDLRKDGKIRDYSINNYEVSEEDVTFNIFITPVSVAKHINTNFTITKDGCEFNNE